MQPLQNCNGPTIRIDREILCLPYAGFLFLKLVGSYDEEEYIFWQLTTGEYQYN